MASLHGEIEELRKSLMDRPYPSKNCKRHLIKGENRRPQWQNTIKARKRQDLSSKNNVYQSLLKAGELKDLIKQGVFGAVPVHKSFGCYKLFRAFPGRFVEVKPSDVT